MPNKKTTTKEFYEDIRKEFERLSNKQEFGVTKYTKEYCLARIAKKYYRSPATVENIVFSRV